MASRYLHALRLTFRRCSWKRFLFYTLLCLVAYNEYGCYLVSRIKWHQLSNKSQNSVRILFVADPQLVGYNDEPPSLLGTVSRWDADMYLQRGFSFAFHHAQPDVIVFLGDLIDEGSRADNKQYDIYFHRFQKIFRASKATQKIYISGDNDVGGEGFDLKQGWKIERFENYFSPLLGVESVKNIVDFLKINYEDSDNYAAVKKEDMLNLVRKCKSKYRIIINHHSLLDMNRRAFSPVVTDVDPDLIISAHSHLGSIYSCSDCRKKMSQDFLWKGTAAYLNHGNNVYDLDIRSRKLLHEIVIPTCSYRMGVPDMGYGFAVLEPNGHFYFTILWLPSRYPKLFSYLTILALLLVAGGLKSCLQGLVSLSRRRVGEQHGAP